MSKFVIRLQFGDGKPREFIRAAYAAHKLQRDIERSYPDVRVLDIYKL